MYLSTPNLKLFGHIKNTKVTMLVDSGSTHNFIESRVTKKLNIFIYPTASFQVSIPGNKTTPCDGRCHKVELAIKEYKIRSPMYVIEIRGVDIVLGAQWLEMLGTVELNLQEQFIRFYENGRRYKLYNINCPPPQIVSSNKMEKMIKRELKPSSYTAMLWKGQLTKVKILINVN